MTQLRLHSFLADRLNLAIITASADIIPLIHYMRGARVKTANSGIIVIDVASRANFGDCNQAAELPYARTGEDGSAHP
ncbi:hypothetical protein ColTof4_13978 [Colletotrichum tofieldiae]|nr:hypothetical protein ColTof3_14612 [Colletotrichum tofieldiae]GKT81555.1 hypothetical protein ColTof4_13978 [Colletotrichum tofieldiae]